MTDETYMHRCLQLAALGLGHTSPNPMVGAVIVHHDRIIGEGYHHRCGEAHAEINAINSVKDTALLKESTLYVPPVLIFCLQNLYCTEHTPLTQCLLYRTHSSDTTCIVCNTLL